MDEKKLDKSLEKIFTDQKEVEKIIKAKTKQEVKDIFAKKSINLSDEDVENTKKSSARS